MDKKVYLFTLEGCSHCNDTKRELNKRKIDFKELEINQYVELWDSIIEVTNQDYVPTVFIQDDDDGSGRIFSPINDYNDTDELIELIVQKLKED